MAIARVAGRPAEVEVELEVEVDLEVEVAVVMAGTLLADS